MGIRRLGAGEGRGGQREDVAGVLESGLQVQEPSLPPTGMLGDEKEGK
jgi:hypothetical protein